MSIAPPMTGMRTAMGTAAGAGGAMAGFGIVRDGKATEQIYSMIRDGRYHDAIAVLTTKQLEFPSSRAAESLLAYCHYYVSDFQSALQCYERLTKMCPEVEEYKLYYAQALFKAGHYDPALKACQNVGDSSGLATRVLMLQAAIKYEQDDLMNTKALIDQCAPEDADTLVNQACVMYKEASTQGAEAGLYEKARLHFAEAMSKTSFMAELAYAIGLCHYQQKQYGPALKLIAEIIERGVREHPELSVGSQTEGVDVRSVGNSLVLKETALIEAFNLKAAIEYQMKNYDAAQEALSDMPVRGRPPAAPAPLPRPPPAECARATAHGRMRTSDCARATAHGRMRTSDCARATAHERGAPRLRGAPRAVPRGAPPPPLFSRPTRADSGAVWTCVSPVCLPAPRRGGTRSSVAAQLGADAHGDRSRGRLQEAQLPDLEPALPA